jgi:hypothetical protein
MWAHGSDPGGHEFIVLYCEIFNLLKSSATFLVTVLWGMLLCPLSCRYYIVVYSGIGVNGEFNGMGVVCGSF